MRQLLQPAGRVDARFSPQGFSRMTNDLAQESRFAGYRVLLVSGSLRQSGSSSWILAMQSALRRAGCPVVHIVLGEPSEVAVAEGFSVIYTGRSRRHPLLRVSRLLQLHKLFPAWYGVRSDRVLNQRVANALGRMGWQGRLELVIKDFTCEVPSYFRHQPVLSVIHQALSASWAHNPKLRNRASEGYRLAAVSAAVAADARQLGLDVKHVLYNPLDITEIQRLGAAFKPAGDYLVYVGKLDRNKGVFELLEAYAESGLALQLWYVGRGNEREQLQRRAVELGVAERVQFLGFQANPYPYMRQARLLVLPSKSEAMSYVCLEAAVLGTPFLVSDYPGALEVFLPSALVALEPQAGFVERLAQRLSEAIAHPVEPALLDGVVARLQPEAVALSYLELVPELATAQ